MTDLKSVAKRVLARHSTIPQERAMLLAISGIDGSGKGFIAARLSEELHRAGHRTGVVGIDGWLNLPGQRFNPANPAGHFYNNALRFEEMFAQLVFPLRSARSIRVEADFAEEQATSFRKHTYAFTNL